MFVLGDWCVCGWLLLCMYMCLHACVYVCVCVVLVGGGGNQFVLFLLLAVIYFIAQTLCGYRLNYAIS